MRKDRNLKNIKEKSAQRKKDFLVVGLGASAGGVKAFQEFFATMPPNSGMAFVAILHLSPEHESSLPQILQAQTQMKVVQVNKEVKVEPNNVYVIPPNVQLEMVDGVIRPNEAERPLGHRVAIDVFFRTLAEAYEKNAVCVVMSGTGSDGTLGLKRVKESNGFAIVQDPDDAEYDSMPRSAINTQLADWVLPVNQMPEKLINFRESSERLHLTNGDGDTDAGAKRIAEEIKADKSLREILTILRVRTGHDFSTYKTPTLVRRIARHLQIHELEDIPSYLDLLRGNSQEVQSLLKNLLINVTNFFRDKEAFQSLEAEVIPNLFAGKTDKDTVRVWSCGCASGEEAYSLAMLLTEHAETLADPPKIQIFASDVDDEAVAEARAHLYPESIEADVSEQRLKRFFIREGSSYSIKKELRECVMFAPHNVLRDPPFSKLDLIVCRNLLIYLNRETQDRVLQVFHFALNPRGYLFLGSSESAESSATFFAPVDKKQRIYSRRHAPFTATTMPLMPVAGRWDVKLSDKKAATERVATLSEIHYKLLENYAASTILVDQNFDIVYTSGEAGKFLRFAGGEPSRSVLKAIHPDLLPDLRAALFTAQRERQPAEFLDTRATIGGREKAVNIIVRVVGNETEAGDFFLVVFEERAFEDSFLKDDQEKIPQKNDALESIVRRLEEDLQRTKEHLRLTIEQHETTVEELKAANEELQAINEELRSASEELETSKEEAQSINEELVTVNSELKEKIEESNHVNADLQNLVQSTDIGTIFLDKELKIKRYTPPIREIFNVTQTDIGRPLTHFTHRLDYDNLAADAAQVLRQLKPIEREISDRNGNYFMTRFVPYWATDDRVEGVVLNFIEITERKLAENLMREFEERFRALVEASSDAVYSMNANWSEMRFLEGKDFIADTENPNDNWIEKYVPLENQPQVLHIINKAIRTKKNFELEHPVNRVDGTVGWTFSRAIPIKNASGKIVEWFGAASDITERKESERALIESEEKYRTLFDSIDEGFCLIEVLFDGQGKAADYRFLEMNLIFERQSGLENARGKTILELVPDLEPQWAETYGQVARTGEAVRFEADVHAMNRIFDIYAFPANAPDTVAVLFTDITERRQSGQALRESEERLRLATEAAEMYSWDYDIKSDAYHFSGNAPKVLGIAKKNLPRNVEDTTKLVHPDDKPLIEKTLKNAVRAGEGFAIDFRTLTKRGKTVWLAVQSTVLKDERGKPARIIGIAQDVTVRKQAEEALHTAEERMRIAIEAGELATWEWHIPAEQVFWNERHFRLFGMKPSREPVKPEDFFRHVHPDDREWLGERLNQSVEQKIPFEAEFRALITGDGVRWMNGYGRVTETIKGKATKMSGVMLDTTARKLAEQALNESETRFRALVNQTAAGIAELDLQGNHTLVNQIYRETLGYTETELLKLNICDVTHPEDLPVCLELFEKAIKTGKPFTNEKRLIRKDGEIVWISDSIARVTDLYGKPVRVVTVAVDITELKQAEEAIRKSEEFMRLVIESAKEYAIVTFDLDGRITRWNAGAEQAFGYAEQEIVGQPGGVLFTPADRALGVPEREIEIALETGRAEDERWHVRKDGTRFFASGVIQPLKDGATLGFVKIARDQTERMQAEKSAQEKETLTRLVATQEDERRRIARDIHDHLGQQMTTLRLKLDAIKKMCGDDKRLCAEIEQVVKTAANLDADVDFIAWELRPAALDELGLRATLGNFVREWAHHTSIEAEFHVSGLSRTQIAHETETNLYRIAQEALNNVYKHAGATQVSVLLERRKDKIILIVEDNGKGFNAEDKKTRQKGIGLSGMAERTRVIGGEFHIESKKGKGTTVFARVPIKQEENQ